MVAKLRASSHTFLVDQEGQIGGLVGVAGRAGVLFILTETPKAR